MIHVDSPLSDPEQDELKRKEFAFSIADYIRGYEHSNSLTVGIHGKWGEGKSTLLHFIKHRLSNNQDFIQFSFNPWQIKGEEELLLSFLLALARTVKSEKVLRQRNLSKLLQEYSESIGELGLPVGVGIMLKLFGKGIGKRLDKDPERIKETINQEILKSQKRIVIYLDDIDRLNNEEIQKLFKIVKLIGDFKNTVYILAFDEGLVSGSLDLSFASGGRAYLEKIVNVPFNLPKVSPSVLQSYTLNLLDRTIKNLKIDVSEKDVHRFRSSFDEILFRLVKNPRGAKKFANASSVILPILRYEANIADILVIEALRILNPEIYHFIRENSSVLLRSYNDHRSTSSYQEQEAAKQRVKNLINDLSAINPFSTETTTELLENLFPQFRSVSRNMSYGDSYWKEWHNDRRICSGYFFERYFSYSLTDSEISEKDFDELIDQLINRDFLRKEEELISLISRYDSYELSLKFLRSESRFSEIQKLSVAKNLCLVGDLYNAERPGMLKQSSGDWMASFIRSALLESNEEIIKHASEIILERAQPEYYACKILFDLFPRKGSDDITEEQYNTLRKLYLDKLKSEYSAKDVLEKEDWNQWFVLELFGDFEPDIVQREIGGLLESNPQATFERLLDIFTSTITSSTMGAGKTETYKSGMTEGYFETLMKVVDGELFFYLSKKFYGEQWGNLKDIDSRGPMTTEQRVGTFQKLYMDRSSSK